MNEADFPRVYCRINGVFVSPLLLLDVLLQVTARHSEEVAHEFASRVPFVGNDSWNFTDIARALNIEPRELYTEWHSEATRIFASGGTLH